MYRLLAKCPSFATGFDGTLTMRAFEELRSTPGTGDPELARYRAWYRWAATLELPGFDADVSGLLDAITLRTPNKKPARKKDPLAGPLTDGEREELLSKTLGASDEDLPLTERVAVLLSMGLGPNAGPLSLLQVQDYSVRSSGGTSYHLLEVPRHKKRLPKERAAFRLRQIDAAWAPHLERLIETNRTAADELYREATGCPRPDGVAIPIFMCGRIRTDLQPSMGEYALHMTPFEIYRLLQNASDRLGARSRFGDGLRLNARRLRSTFATNLIADGKPKRVVADALDHMSIDPLSHYELEDYRLSVAIKGRPARQIRSRKRLAPEDIEAIVKDLDEWSKPKITWSAVVVRVEALLKRRRFSRQALEGQDDIYAAYARAKKRLRDGVVPSKRKPLAERLAAVQAENRKLRAENDVLSEQFVTWLFNAESYGVRAAQLNEPLPAARLASDVRDRELKRRAQHKRARLAHRGAGHNTLQAPR